MAFIVPIAATIWSAVAAAAAAVATIIPNIVIVVAEVVMEIGFAVEVALAAILGVDLASTVVSVACTLYSIASVAYSVYGVITAFTSGDTAGAIGGIVGAVGAIYSIAGDNLKGFVDTVYTGFKEFTQAINLELALKISDIVALTSDSYRESMNNVYLQIGKVSNALGNSGEFMQLLLRDAKLIIQDTAAVMGRRYDLGEIVWLQTLEDFLKTFSEQTLKYKDNPGELIQDIDKWVFKPAVDTKAAVFQNLYGIVDTVLATSKNVIAEISDVRDNVHGVMDRLPLEIKKEIDPYIDGVFNKYDTWIQTYFHPTIQTLEITISQYRNDYIKMGQELYLLVNYLKNPADFLARIADLSQEDRFRVQGIIVDLLLKGYNRDVSNWTETTGPQRSYLDGIRRLIDAKIEIPAWDVGEIETPQRPARTQVEPRKTWFVKDE